MPGSILYLFDVDGTLLLSGGAGAAALDLAFEARYGLREAMKGISPAGKTDPLIITEVFEKHWSRRPKISEIEDILAAYIPFLHDRLERAQRFRLMPAVLDTLDFLASQPEVHLGVATGNIESGARAKLQRAGLWRRFALGGYGDDSADRAALVAAAIARGRAHAGREIPEDRVVVVGDTPRDVRAAQACGVRAVAVATGSVDRSTLEQTGADEVFDTLAELPAWHNRELT